MFFLSDKTPFFSVLIPSFNRPVELERSVKSILNSEFKDYEIIISDDKSPKQNEIHAVVSTFLEHDNILFFRQKTNLGEPANKNFLVQHAAGKYNIILGDDDTLADGALGFLFKFIESYPKFDIYGFGYEIVNEVNQPLSRHCSTKVVDFRKQSSRLKLLEGGIIPMALFHPATFCCRSGLEQELPYRDDVGIGEDLCFLLQANIKRKSIIVVPRIMFHWRKVQNVKTVDQGNQSAAHLSSYKSRKLILNVLEKESGTDILFSQHIFTKRYRFKFLYFELLRDSNLNDNPSDLQMTKERYNEYKFLKNSSFWRLRIAMSRLEKFLDIAAIIGFRHALKMGFRVVFSKLATWG